VAGVYLGGYIVTFTVLRNASDPTSTLIAPKYRSPIESTFKITVDGNKEGLEYKIERAPGAGP
jgi:hypothetical protein